VGFTDKAARAEWQLGVPEFSLPSRAAACSGKMRRGKAFVAFLIPDFSFPPPIYKILLRKA